MAEATQEMIAEIIEKLRSRASEIPGEIAERENEATSHCGPYGTDTAEDFMDDEDVLLMHDAADALERLTAQSGEGRSGAGEREAATCANNARVGREGEQLREALSHRGSMSVVAGGGQKPFVKITFGSLALAYAASDALHAALNARQSGEGEWLRPMEEAPKDGTYILAIYKSLNGYASQLEGRVFAVRHEGKTPSDHDLGWALFPGHGGVPDKCFYGWIPIPDALRATDDAGGA